jgi:RHS repeat-associated protein
VPLDTAFPTGIRCTGPSGDTAANDQDQLCEYGGFTYSYNARGQLESKSDGMAITSYSYDGLGRLLRVTEPGMSIHYVLDALGRRIGKIRDGNLERGWLYADALNPIAELDGAGNVRATFLYGTRAHVSDAMVLTDGTVYRLITDHLGSVRLVVNATTGEVVQRMDYDAFGRVLRDTAPGFQPFGFAGGLYDDDTGFVRFGARDYDAYSGRWTAKDPILFDGASANLYAYVGSDPVNFLDPLGLSPLDCFKRKYLENLETTNDFFFSGFTKWSRSAIGFITSGAVARSFGFATLGDLITTYPVGVANLTLGETAASVALNSAVNSIFVAAALEAGIIVGSAAVGTGAALNDALFGECEGLCQ